MPPSSCPPASCRASLNWCSCSCAAFLAPAGARLSAAEHSAAATAPAAGCCRQPATARLQAIVHRAVKLGGPGWHCSASGSSGRRRSGRCPSVARPHSRLASWLRLGARPGWLALSAPMPAAPFACSPAHAWTPASCCCSAATAASSSSDRCGVQCRMVARAQAASEACEKGRAPRAE